MGGLVSKRRKKIQNAINSRLEKLGGGDVLEVEDLSEEEMEHFSRKYNNEDYRVVGSDVDFEHITEDGRLRYCFSLTRRLKNA
jgi:hypothetical protein